MTQFLDEYEISLHFPKLAAIFKKKILIPRYITLSVRYNVMGYHKIYIFLFTNLIFLTQSCKFGICTDL